jgi:DNA modification methylase
MSYQLFVGNNLEILPNLPDNSVDSIVTDPPYGLSDNKYVADTIARWIAGERDFVPDGKGFMGKSWDAFVPPPALWDECLRVLKPGGHLLSFFGSRTQDIGALAIRLAGFEIRDSIAWLYGSGFPKSMDIGKAIDKQSGFEGKVLGTELIDIGIQGGSMHAGRETKIAEREIKELSLEAQQWQGWGTALKPALEPIVVARKPITEGTIATNVLKWGTGGLNIDRSRIGRQDGDNSSAGNRTATFGTQDTNSGGDGSGGWEQNSGGRWPANIILDPYTAELLDEQSGERGGSGKASGPSLTGKSLSNSRGQFNGVSETPFYGDSGGASRFFYVAKASKTDRSEGLGDLPLRKSDQRSEVAAGIWADMKAPKQNFHPTVKPTALMAYLIRLVTPPGGTVLDPFTGSGSTGKAAILNGFGFIGIEMTQDYVPIIEGRLKHAEKTVAEAKEQETLEQTEKLF